MLASERDDEKVERRRFAKECHSAPQTEREKLELRPLPFTRYQKLRESPLVQSIPRSQIERGNAIQFIARQQQAIADHVRNKVASRIQPLESERQKL
jgi:hypothetical protein